MIAELLIVAALVAQSQSGHAAAPPDRPDTKLIKAHTPDLIYGRPHGTALTMDEFLPSMPWNGKVGIVVVSGGWYSSHEAISSDNVRKTMINPLLNRGYKVYAVVHRSSPRFTIEEAVADVRQAVRFIRHREAEDGNTSIPIGILGASAGGHLSLMMGTTGDDGMTTAKLPVEKHSSRVQAVACYFPPTDFLNYGQTGVNVLETTVGLRFPPSFDFTRQEKDTPAGPNSRFSRVSDEERRKILEQVSPITHVTPDDAPVLIIHGDTDWLVPIQQAEIMIDRLKEAGVDAELVVKPGLGHGWGGIEKDSETLVDWFDKNL